MYQIGCQGCCNLMGFGQPPLQPTTLIANMQIELVGLGFDVGKPGTWDSGLIKNYQKKVGLEVTGKPDYITVAGILYQSEPTYSEWAALYKYVTGKTPNEGTWNLQLSLRRLGFNPGPIDGLMGSKTKAAITTWQKTEGLPATGTLTTAQEMKLLADAVGEPEVVPELLVTAEADEEAVVPSSTPGAPPPPELPAIPPDSPEVTAAIRQARDAGIPVVEKQDATVTETKVVYVREPGTQEVIRVEKLIPVLGAERVVSPWIWVAGGVVGVLAVGGIVALILRARSKPAVRAALPRKTSPAPTSAPQVPVVSPAVSRFIR